MGIMVKTAHVYSIRKQSTPIPGGGTAWVVGKLDEDFNPVDIYTVTEKTNQDKVVYHCSCPAYKDLCKHIHWVKALKLRMNREPGLTSGLFNPATNNWDK